MNLLQKLDMLMQQTGDNKHTLANKSGIPYTTIDGLYKKGYAGMRLTTLQVLCDYFNVSLDYLAKDDEESFDYEAHGIAARQNVYQSSADSALAARMAHVELMLKKQEEQGRMNLTEEEESLIENYRMLSKKDKTKARRIMAALADKTEGI